MSKDKKPCGSHVCGNCHLSNENSESNFDSSDKVNTNSETEHESSYNNSDACLDAFGILDYSRHFIFDLCNRSVNDLLDITDEALRDHMRNLIPVRFDILSFKLTEGIRDEQKYSYQIYHNCEHSYAMVNCANFITDQSIHNDSGAVNIETKLKVTFQKQYTFAIIKPDAYKDADKIIEMMQSAGLHIATIDEKPLKLTKHLTHSDSARFYSVHSHRGCFPEMCDFMSSGECMLLVLCGVDAIKRYRTLMGATDPLKADRGTIRTMYGGKTIGSNAVHGSDSPESVVQEMEQFFPGVLEKL